jgi:putative oxidoreductase
MPAFIVVGRVLFALLFIVSGASKLFDIASTAQDISAKIIIPALLMPYTTQIETTLGMSMPQLLALLTGVLEVICGLMLMFNLGIRFFAFVLIVFVATVTFYFHDFWNQGGIEARNNMVHFLKNIAIIGALLMMFGYGRGARPAPESIYQDR